MNEKVASVIQKAQQERKRAQFDRALKRLEQAIASHPDDLDLHLEVIDTALEAGEVSAAATHLKTVQDRFTRERERVQQFVREKLRTVHDVSLARCVVEHAVKRRDFESTLALLEDVPDHIVRDLVGRTRTKAQSLKSAGAGGYTVRGEALANELAGAVLSVRLGNLKEAMTTLVRLVEEKPVEYKGLDPFLIALSAKHPKSGRIHFARGCVLRAGGNEIDAIHAFLEGARLEPACAASCAEQLRAMLEQPVHPAKIRHALAETLLLKGDMAAAASVLREHLAENPENGREVIMLLRPFLDPSGGVHEGTWLAMETALGLEQSSVALEIMRGLHQHGSHGADLYTWLEERSAAGPLPGDVVLFQASLALEQKHFERAAEILSGVCSTSSQDVAVVLSMIDRHRSAHPALEELYRRHAVEETMLEDAQPADDGDEFQMFEANEFRLGGGARPASAPAPRAPDGSAPRFSSSPFSSGGGPQAGARPAVRKSFIEATELSFDDDGAVVRADGEDAMKDNQPVAITDSHVTHVAQQLYLAGAAAFFHIDDGASAGDSAAEAHEPAPAGPAAATDDGAGDGPSPPPDRPAPAPDNVRDEPFAARYDKFTRGELSNPAVLALIDEAVREGLVDELHELLCFQPQTTEEHFARYYYQAEYHLLCHRPLQALDILARLDTPGLRDEESLRVGYRIAVAQRMAHNYAGAAATLERLVERFPGREDLARLKKRNQEQFIEEQSLTATTLEKTSSLD